MGKAPAYGAKMSISENNL